jgi:hypothetical protein
MKNINGNKLNMNEINRYNKTIQEYTRRHNGRYKYKTKIHWDITIKRHNDYEEYK